MKVDFHVHTKYSIDALISIDDLIKKSRKLGIVPAVTDHNNIDAHAELRKRDAEFIGGEEIKTEEGFDLIGLYINEKIEKKTPFAEAVDRIKEQGGLVYLPHPFDVTRSGIGKERISLVKKVDIVEVFNARTIFENANKEANEVAEQYRKQKGAGSDSHFLFEFGSTYVEMEECDLENQKELLKKLKNANIIGKKAPFYVRGAADIVATLKKVGLRV
jgi:predicted metal-dependent phosphoesterase TrpH